MRVLRPRPVDTPDIDADDMPDDDTATGDESGGALVPVARTDDSAGAIVPVHSGDARPARSHRAVQRRHDGHGPHTPATTDRNNGTDMPDGPGDVDDQDEPDADPVVLVDAPDVQRAPRWGVERLREAQRAPIMPGWAHSWAQAKDAVKVVAGHVGYEVSYHAVRLPKYAGRLMVRCPVGAVRVVRGTFRWLFDLSGEPVRQAAARHEDAAEWLALARHRDHRVRWRGIVTTIAAALAIITVTAVLLLAPGWMKTLTLAGLVVVFGIAGRPQDRPLLDTAVTVPQAIKLTSDHVIRALSSLSLAGINQALAKNPKAIAFTAPIRQDGPGWRADIELPPGVTAAEVIERRDKLAAGLGRPLGAVWPEPEPDIHPGRLALWVGRQDMASAKQPPWPLLKTGRVDLFGEFPFGTDPRGRACPLGLMETNMLIGSIPGMGKTFSLMVPLLAASLDPRAELWVYNLKGTSDLKSMEKVAARYATGTDDDTIEQVLYALRDLRKECQRRAKILESVPVADCPENKVIPELARKKSLRLHPLVVAIDECQELFSHPTYGDEAGKLAEKIIKLARALGVITLWATQRPDSKSLPTGVSANVGTRFCLRVMGQTENDMILGTSSYKNGLRATMFTKKDRGVGYLVGAADDPQIVRTYFVPGPAADAVADRARRLREAAGTLSGHAIGDTQDSADQTTRTDTLLEDVLTVCPPEEGSGKFWTEIVLTRLAALRPEVYGDWSRDQLTANLRSHGVATKQVWGTDGDKGGAGANRRGIDVAEIEAAVTDRNQQQRGW